MARYKVSFHMYPYSENGKTLSGHVNVRFEDDTGAVSVVGGNCIID